MATFLIRFTISVVVIYIIAAAVVFALQDRFLFPAPQERHDPVKGFEAVSLDTKDGLTLTAHWQAPLTGKPSIVWFHGNGGSLQGAAAETALLAGKGYGVLLAPYRGYGGNPGDPSEEGFYEDGRAAMGFLASTGVPRTQTIIAGNSIGSGTAVEMAQRFDPAALILVSPFASLSEVVSAKLPWLPVSILLRHRFENAEKIEALKMPVLVMHGTADRVVPFEQGRKLAEATSNSTFEEFAGVGHDLSFQIQAQRIEAQWLESQGL